MNPNYNYPHKHLWDKETWADRVSPIEALTIWMSHHDTDAKAPVDDSLYADKGSEACYSNKTFSYDVPEVIKYWDEKGIHYECREMGGTRWISMVPTKSYEDTVTRIPAILVLHQENYEEPYWAMHTVKYFEKYNEAAANDGMAVIYVTGPKPGPYDYRGVINEVVDLFPVDAKQLWLDVSIVKASGATLREAGLDLDDDSIISMGSAGIPCVDVSQIWQHPGDNWLYMLHSCSADIDKERIINSAQGEKIAWSADFQYSYSSPDDPALNKLFGDMGVACRCHDYMGHRWCSAAPTALAEDGRLLPVVLIFQEVNYANDYFVLSAYSQYFEFIRLAAAGELIALFFARETPENNDMFRPILDEACKLFPIDRSRVYVTGHSHNGNFAMEFMRRNHDLVAAVAALGDQPGMPHPSDCIEPVRVTDDKIELMTGIDIPVANISGMCEMGCLFPIGKDADNVRADYFCQNTKAEGRIRSWQRRLKAFNIAPQSEEDIRASVTEGDYVTRKLGIPGGRKSMVTLDGFEHYIADYDNKDGKWCLRIIGIENMPHMPVPSMEVMAWDFVRRFARDAETGESVELKG